tara:strand:- start:163 stop:381 length:219 start_codon:yes stop_codon:yes gene_type:complete
VFTKKHFIQIAGILKNQRIFLQNTNAEGFEKRILHSVESELIELFKTENPRFDVQRFLEASNPSQAEKELAI